MSPRDLNPLDGLSVATEDLLRERANDEALMERACYHHWIKYSDEREAMLTVVRAALFRHHNPKHVDANFELSRACDALDEAYADWRVENADYCE